MTIKIGIISDPHAAPEPVAEALEIFRREEVSQVLCAGDIGGYGNEIDETVALLKEHEVICVRGNHEEWALARQAFPGSKMVHDYFVALPDHLSLTIEGIRIYMVHAEPPNRLRKGLRLLNESGDVIPEVLAEWHDRLNNFDHDVLIIGHTHQVYDVRLAQTLVINPGSCCFNHSCAILHLPELQVEWFALSGRKLEPVWNWGASLVNSSSRQ